MTDRRSDNFESALRRHRLEPPPPALRQAALSSAAAEEPLFRREPAARWDRLVPAAAVFVILFSAAVSFTVGPVAPDGSSSSPSPAPPVAISVQPSLPGQPPRVTFLPQPPPPVDWKALQKERHVLEAMIRS